MECRKSTISNDHLGGKYISILLYNTTNNIFDSQLKRYVFEKK